MSPLEQLPEIAANAAHQQTIIQGDEIEFAVPDMPDGQAIFNQIVADIRDEYLSESQAFPWIIGFSGGKDSTLVVHAVFAALLDISPNRLIPLCQIELA